MSGRKNTVVARLTLTRQGAPKLIVEVHEGADFHSFYRWFHQEGRKRKKFLRSSNRNTGIHPQFDAAFRTPGLDVVAARQDFQKHVTGVTIQVFKKRKYQALLTCSPSELGLPTAAKTAQIIAARKGIPVVFPENYLTLQERMDILTGVKR